MIHVKTYEASLRQSEYQKYLDFVADKFEIENRPFGKVQCNEFNESKNGIEISIRFGSSNGIDPNYLRSIMDYFIKCKSNISTYRDYLSYNVFLTWNFLENLDTEIEAKKYNL